MGCEITVIVPTYNRAEFLGETLESVLSQDAAARIIVVDDGSTDNTYELKERYRRDVVWISQPNRGEVRTVNRGLQLVDTPYFSIVNSDDPLLPGSLRRMIDELAVNSEAPAAYCDWLSIDENSQSIGEVRIGLMSFEDMMYRDNNPVGPGAVFRSSVLSDVGLRDPLLKYSADLDFWHRIALCGRIAYVPEVLATHRVHAGSGSITGRGAALSSEVAHLRSAYVGHPRWRSERGAFPAGYARRRLALCAGHFSAAFVATSARAGGRELVRAFQLAPMRALTLLEAHGIGQAASEFAAMEGRVAGYRFKSVSDLFGMGDRRAAFRALARAMLNDPLGVIEAVKASGIETVRDGLRSMRVRNSI